MESRARGIWWWIHVSFTTLIRLGVVAAAIILVIMRLEPSDAQASRLVSQVYRARLVLALCLLVALLATKLVGLSIFCAVCALWAVLSYAVLKMASDAYA